jgi:zinc transport system permease protein
MGLVEAFSLPFMQRALVAGVAIAAICGLLGVFVVQRRLSFLGDGLAHAAFGGLGLGAFVSVTAGLGGAEALLRQPLLVALPFALLVALGIAWLRDRTDLSSDTAIGVFFAVAVSLGVLFFSIIPPDAEVGVDVLEILFGSILGIRGGDLVLIVVVAGLSLALLLVLWGRLAYATFDEELARTDGVPARSLEYLLFALSAVVIVISTQVVGVILMAAFLVIPAAAARLWSRSLVEMSLLSVAVGIVSTVVGLALSFVVDVPSGSAIVLSQAALFGVALAAARFRDRGPSSAR